jgi:hypothetical protein
MGNIHRKNMHVHWQKGLSMNFHWQKGLSLEETLEEGRTHELPWAKGAAAKGNIQRKDMNVHWQKGLSGCVCVETPENSLLQELLSHAVNNDDVRGKQKLSRSMCS